MKDDIVIPPGLMRTRIAGGLAWLFFVMGAAIGGYEGHRTARIETHIDRVEVPYPDQCIDEMHAFDSDDKKISCSHPEHHGEFRDISWDAYVGTKHYLVCTCAKPQLNVPEAGAK